MSFDRRDIRPAMDVYTRDNAYLGAILQVQPGSAAARPARAADRTAATSAPDGELLGPAPTQTIGNRGPATQGAASGYAAAPDEAEPVGAGLLIVGKWWGLVGRRAIPIDAVHNVSLERVALALTKAELDGRP